MNKINNKNNIHIHLYGLQQKEHVIFERVINFNQANGVPIQVCDNRTLANLVIATESTFSTLESIKDNQVVMVITKNTTLGDMQLEPPLLVTRVMKALQDAIKLANKRRAVTNNIIKDKDTPTVSTEVPISDSNAIKNETEKETATLNNNKASTQSGLRALVIDDSAAIRKQLELELRTANIMADFAESGEQAIEKIKQTQFDLLFLDIMMPGIDGYETCKIIRSNATYKKTPIIMLSGKTSPLDEVQGIIAGATTYLTKPVKSDGLQKVLSRVTTWITDFKVDENKKQPVV